MGVARHFDGSPLFNDYLTPPGSSLTFSTGITCASWVKRDSAGATSNGIMGRLFSSSNGWGFYVDAGNMLSFLHDSFIDQVASPDLSEWCYVAVTYDNTDTKFYYGTTAANLALIATVNSPSLGFTELSTYGRSFGAITFGDLISSGSWNGDLDQMGLWATPLTLAELKSAAICGAVVQEGASLQLIDITGADPEPFNGGGVPGNLTVVGTTVVSGDPVGCDYADPGEVILLEVAEIVRQVEYLELTDLLPQTCSLIPRVRILRLDDLVQVMELTGYEFLRYTKDWQRIGEFEFRINGKASKAEEMRELSILGNIGSPSSINNFIINISYDGVSDFSGIIDYPFVEWMDDGTEMIVVSGLDLKRWLADRTVQAPTGLDHDSYSGVQETIIKSLIERHLISPIATDALGFNDSQRAIDYLLNAPDLTRGIATTFEGRNQTLYQAIEEIANRENEYGFGFSIEADTVVFDIYEGQDLSDSVVFDRELGNVSNMKIEWDGMNFVTHALLAGQGEGAARVMRNTQTSPATFSGARRRELYQDARDLDTEAKLIDRGKAVIADRSRILRMSAKKIMARGPCYKDDFNLGDLVTVRDRKYNVSQAVKIYQVQVIHQAQAAPEVLLTWNAPTAPSAFKLIRDDIAPSTSRT